MLEAETTRMMKAYGNHPSFLMLSPSNEPKDRYMQVLPGWAAKWHEQDPRRVYAAKSGWGPVPAGGPQPQYDVLAAPRGNRGWFGNDFAAVVQGSHMPIVTHELGQWCAYPDFDIIKKFTGYLQPGNYEIFRDSAAAHGVLEKNKQFAWASGRFQVACYKEEIEANLRTPGLAGFQLLDLHDYLGQGGALIGLLDAFWQSKGYVTAEEFHRFCAPTVPLARFHSYIFRAGDTFDIPVEVANFSAGEIKNATPYWRIVDLDGLFAAQGELPKLDVPIGKGIPLGHVKVDLKELTAPKQYKLVVELQSPDQDKAQQTKEAKLEKIENDWNFWLYPAADSSASASDVLLTTDWKEAQAKLNAGGKVVYVPPPSAVDDTCPPLDSVPVFWNRLMNPKLSAMLGLLCDPKHPALADFPTQANCDWQWTDLVRNMRTVNLDHAPKELQPIVQAIDDWNRNFKLGVIFECKVGSGRLLICAVDITKLNDRRPAAVQLRKSLLDYAAGEHFQPTVALTSDQATALWPGLAGRGFKAGPQGIASPDIDEGPAQPPAKQ
jgi:hypothetical protein